MKKLTLFLLLCSWQSVWAQAFKSAELKESTSITRDKTDVQAGLSLKWDFLDLRGFVSLKEQDQICTLEDKKWGASLNLFEDSFPVTIKAGNLSTSRSLSRLRSPAPSLTCSPFASAAVISPGTGTSLPSLSGSVQPLSAGISLSTDILKTELFYTEDNSWAFCADSSLKITGRTSVRTAVTAGRFFLVNNTSALKKANASFTGDWYYCGLFESYFRAPCFRLTYQQAFYQSPYSAINKECSPVNTSVRISQSLYLKNLLISASYFCIPFSRNQPQAAPLISSSAAVCRTVEQLELNPQLIFLTGKNLSDSVCLGIHAAETWKVTSTKNPVSLNTAKIRSAVRYDSEFFSTTLDFTAANILLSGTPPDSSSTPEKYFLLKFNNTIRNDLFRLDSDLGYKYIPPKTDSSSIKKEYTVSTSVNAALIKALTLSFSGSIIRTGSRKTTGDFSVSGTIRLSSQKVRTYAKITFNSKFD